MARWSAEQGPRTEGPAAVGLPAGSPLNGGREDELDQRWAKSELDRAETSAELEDIEIAALLEAIYRFYGADFRSYARGSLRRRLRRRAELEGITTISGLQERLLHDRACMERLLADLSINVTSMFRDPAFYRAFREKVLPHLATYPFIRIWNPGCSTGEETYSLAMLLSEAGLYERTRIYATDINAGVLAVASRAVFPLEKMREYTENYLAAGGDRAFSEYYVSGYDGARFDPRLARNIVFARHNLASDSSFNEFHAVVCRNVMIYFDVHLQRQVHELFYSSLPRLGVLALGGKESLAFSGREEDYETVDGAERIYRKR
ncbi:MAG: Chemotaxis protein CheR [Acidimicrobiaceae bacterium]|nr:Chemotaxis protein CheR [Acidimicrobiaceae bacterium]